MTYKDILYVITILDEGSFSAAAKKLYVSQSALSQAVRKLEQEFGMELFIRSGGSTQPTKACRIFTEQGRRVLQVWNQLESEMHMYAKRRQSDLTIGIPALLIKSLLPFFSPRFEEASRETFLYVVEERTATLENLTAQEALDLCIIQGPLQNTTLASIQVLTPELLLAVPKDHPFCRCHPYRGLDQLEEVDLSELQDERFSLLNHPRFEQLFSRLFRSAGFEPKVYRRSSMWSNIAGYIQSGKSVGFLDEMVVLHELRDDALAFYRLKSGPVTSEILVAFHPGKHLSSTEQLVIDILKTYPLLRSRTGSTF